MLFELKSVFLSDGEEKRLNYELDMSSIDVGGVFPFTSPVAVSAVARNRASLVTLTVGCGYDYTAACDRCGEVIWTDDSYGDEYIETPDFTVELDEIVISDILLNLPQKRLCKEDCKGLCPVCGHNLNNGDCECEKQPADPRLAVLKQLMDE